MDALKPILELQNRMRELEHTMAEQSGEELEKSLELYNRYTHEFEYKNGYSCESEANGVLKGLGFSKEDYDCLLYTSCISLVDKCYDECKHEECTRCKYEYCYRCVQAECIAYTLYNSR